jgi:DNA-binding NarL/FixJ family response regulator
VTGNNLGAALITDLGSTRLDPSTGNAGTTVAVVADRRLSLAALTALLLKRPGHRLVAEARGLAEVAGLLQGSEPPVVVVEYSHTGWPSPINPAQWGGRTLLLVDPNDGSDVFVRAARAGVFGYLARSASGETLAAAIESLRNTGYYVDPRLGQRILFALRDCQRIPVADHRPLTAHERNILVRVASGRSSKEIAREYAISPKTVANLVTNIRQKLNLGHRGELVLYAARQGWTADGR